MDINAKFEDFIRNLRPGFKDKDRVNQALLEIEDILKNELPFQDSEYIYSGAYKRETMLKSHPEAELIIGSHRKKTSLKDLYFKAEKLLKSATRTVIRAGFNKLTILVKDENPAPVKIDILLSFRVNSPRQMQELKRPDLYEGYASNFQTLYLNKQRATFKRFSALIILIKHWAIFNEVPLSPLLIELMAPVSMKKTEMVDWKDYISDYFNLLKEFITGSAILPVNWDKKFGLEEIKAEKSVNGLKLVDPANPNVNLAAKLTENEILKIKQSLSEALGFIKNNDWNSLFKTDFFTENELI